MLQLPTDGLVSKRLTLRPPQTIDADALKQIMGMAAVTRWLTDIPSPFTDAHAEDWIARCKAGWADCSAYALFAFQGDHLVGSVTLTRMGDDEANIGFWLSEAFWGQGLGLEMVGAVSHWNFEQDGFLRLLAGVHPDNHASIRLFERLGYVALGERLYILPPHDHRVMGPHYLMTREIWQANRLSKDQAP